MLWSPLCGEEDRVKGAASGRTNQWSHDSVLRARRAALCPPAPGPPLLLHCQPRQDEIKAQGSRHSSSPDAVSHPRETLKNHGPKPPSAGHAGFLEHLPAAGLCCLHSLLRASLWGSPHRHRRSYQRFGNQFQATTPASAPTGPQQTLQSSPPCWTARLAPPSRDSPARRTPTRLQNAPPPPPPFREHSLSSALEPPPPSASIPQHLLHFVLVRCFLGFFPAYGTGPS